MFENLCTLPLTSQLFSQALHPTESVLAVGLAGGHVESYRLPACPSGSSSEEDDMDTSLMSSGTSTINTEWRTRRHNGSCRTLAYSIDGEALYSSGTDGIVKAASSHTGRVFAKIAIPSSKTDPIDTPSLLHTLSPQVIILATDSAALYVYDLRQSNHISSRPAQNYQPHDEYITSLTALPPSTSSTSGFSKQWVSTGGTTLAVTDLRKGVISRSEDQGEELLSSVFVGGLPVKPGRSSGEKIILGDSSGTLTLWEKGFWDDQQERIKVACQWKNVCSLESLALVPENVGDGKNIVVGNENGYISIVKLGPNKIISRLQHDEIDGVVALGFDVENRLISGGGNCVKVWNETLSPTDTSEDEEDTDDTGDESCESSDEASQTNHNENSIGQKRGKPKVGTSGSMNAHGIMTFQGLD